MERAESGRREKEAECDGLRHRNSPPLYILELISHAHRLSVGCIFALYLRTPRRQVRTSIYGNKNDTQKEQRPLYPTLSPAIPQAARKRHHLTIERLGRSDKRCQNRHVTASPAKCIGMRGRNDGKSVRADQAERKEVRRDAKEASNLASTDTLRPNIPSHAID
jgi:hypothetical protein